MDELCFGPNGVLIIKHADGERRLVKLKDIIEIVMEKSTSKPNCLRVNLWNLCGCIELHLSKQDFDDLEKAWGTA